MIDWQRVFVTLLIGDYWVFSRSIVHLYVIPLPLPRSVGLSVGLLLVQLSTLTCVWIFEYFHVTNWFSLSSDYFPISDCVCYVCSRLNMSVYMNIFLLVFLYVFLISKLCQPLLCLHRFSFLFPLVLICLYRYLFSFLVCLCLRLYSLRPNYFLFLSTFHLLCISSIALIFPCMYSFANFLFA